MAEIPTDEYFVHRPILQPQTRARTAAAPRASEGVEAARTEIAFAAGSSRAMNRVMAVLFVLAGVVAGFGVPFLLYLFLSIGFWGTSSGDTGFLVGLGVFIAGCGIAGGI